MKGNSIVWIFGDMPMRHPTGLNFLELSQKQPGCGNIIQYFYKVIPHENGINQLITNKCFYFYCSLISSATN